MLASIESSSSCITALWRLGSNSFPTASMGTTPISSSTVENCLYTASIPLTKAFSFSSSATAPRPRSKLSTTGRIFSTTDLAPISNINDFSFSERFLKFSNSAILRRSRSFNSSIFSSFLSFLFFFFSFAAVLESLFSSDSGAISPLEVRSSSFWISSVFSSAAISSVSFSLSICSFNFSSSTFSTTFPSIIPWI